MSRHRMETAHQRRNTRGVEAPRWSRASVCLWALLTLLLVGEPFLRGQQTPPAQTTTPAAQPPSAQPQPAQAPTAQTATTPAPAAAGLPKVSVDVRAVTVLASVRDKHGKLIPNLTKDDFQLEEDGHPQTIKYFAKETDLPLTLGLLVDTSMSQRRVLDQERSATRTFIDHLIREDRDKGFLIHFDHEIELLQDLTPSRQKLEAALDQVGAPQFSQTSSSSGGSDPDDNSRGGGGRGGGSGRGSRGGGGTALYDAVYLASDEVMKKQSGRKAAIVLSDGVDRGSKETLQEAIETAQRADTMVYSIYFVDKDSYGNGGGGFGGPRMGGMGGGGMGGGGMGRGGGGQRRPQEQRPDGKKILEQLSRETGGHFYEVTKKQTIEQIYTEIDEELRNQYNLGYTPEKTDAGPGYHKIQLTAKQKDAAVQTREGFYIGQ